MGRNARVVGYALHKTPRGMHIPWHRVINSKGMISFPRHSVQEKTQRKLLEMEGVRFSGTRVDLSRTGWPGRFFTKNQK